MSKENVSLNLVLKKIDETRNQLLEEIKHNDLISEKHKKVCRIFVNLNFFFFSTFSVFGSISAFNSLTGVPVGIMNSQKRVEGFYEGLKICAIIAGVKNYKSITKKKRKNIIKQCCQQNTKLNSIGVLISKALIDLYINDDKLCW